LEKVEGIVLRSLPYREQEKILTLFTAERGLISLIVKKISKKSSHLLALSSLFCQGEFLYEKGNSDLYRFLDGSLLDEHLFLRQNWRYLEAASKLTKALLHSQLPGKPAPHLYALFISYLRQIPHFEEPLGLFASFYLKLLHHEGVLGATRFQPLLSVRSFTELKKITISPSDLSEIEAAFRTF
jgi:DNA repair protein RecO (recombination protein O)